MHKTQIVVPCDTPSRQSDSAENKTKKVIKSLLAWYKENGRHELPWRKTRDPYKILVSELMLQQTQVPRVIPKYSAFIERFPTLKDLAQANRTEVLQLWQGLGYNNRAVRLHALAKINKLPKERKELLKLPGIGPYTAGAVQIFAYNTPAVSVDVNVERVLQRVFVVNDIELLAVELLKKSGDPHAWQSALMDFGSAVCTRNPKCNTCPLYDECKSKGVRPDEKTAKQSKFLGSNRWWRGQILKTLLKGSVKEQHLIYKIKEQPTAEEQDAYAKALQGMMVEGLVIKEKELKLSHQ